MIAYPVRIAAAVAVALVVGGCSETLPLENEGPEGPAMLTVDASTSWAFVALGETATPRTVSDPESSMEWDVAFNATRVMLNGGAAGPGGVVGHCLCQNAGATDAAVQLMTPEDQLAAFDAVTLADVPTTQEAWQTDALDAAISGWYAYNPTTHQVSAAPQNVWKVRGAGENPEYVKLHVTALSNATQQGAQVTIEFAVQPAAGAQFSEVQTAVLDGRTAPVYFDFETGVSSAANWDIMLDGYDVRINGGVSGSGGAGAVKVDESFAAVADASDMTASHYRADAFGGVFAAHPWYRYNLDGNHTIFPTYDVFLIKRGSDVYKVQLIGYYNTAGDSRHITFRYARLES